ncbi:MAG TPA: sulfurtransferase TusA family protein [Sphingobium sp.]|nr:sulfurtransferase TusA family protein [Sphingobium sp.]
MPTNDPAYVDARGMKCPWPALRAARAMRSTDRVMVEADDPIAPGELQALARQQGWQFAATGEHRFLLIRPV